MGKSRRLITGLAIRETMVNPTPANSKLFTPSSKTIPSVALETASKATVSMTKWRSIFFITLSINRETTSKQAIFEEVYGGTFWQSDEPHLLTFGQDFLLARSQDLFG